MKTLKRTLALVLVLALSLSFFAFSASASFSDDSKIEYKDEVSILTGLGIIEGFEDGSFQPAGDVTRAQMAKLIAYALLGEDDAEDLTAKTDVFSDVPASHWAAGYILFCKNMGIIDGYGDGTFGPSANVTGYQVAKMILCAVGYGQNDEYTGTNWASTVSKKALALGLFEGNLAGLNDMPASREEACLYLWNGLNLQTVTYDGDGYVGITYTVSSVKYEQTLAHKNYKVATATGLLTANAATTAKYQADEAKDVDAKSVIGGVTYTIDTGLDLIGHTVTVYYKEGDTTTAYSVVDKTKLFATLTVVAAGDDNDARAQALADAGFKVDATATNASVSVAVYNDYDMSSSTSTKLSALTEGDTYIFLSNSTDKVPVYAIKITEQIYKVDKLNDTTEVLTVKDYNNSTKYIDYDDVVAGLDTIAKGDYVVGTQVNGAFWSFAVAETVTGPVTAVNSAKNTITINGTKYSKSTATLGTTSLNEDVKAISAIDKDYIEDEISTTLYLDSAGNFMMIVANEDSTSSSLILAYDCVNKLASDGDYYTTNSYVKAITLDGTQVTYMTAKGTQDSYSGYGTAGGTAAKSVLHTNPLVFMTVSVNDKGVATLTAIKDDGTVKAGGTAYYLDAIAASTKLESDDTTVAVTNASTSNTKDYLTSATKYVFISWDSDDEVYDIKVVTGGVNYTTPAAGAQSIATKSGSNYIADTVAFGAAFSDAGVEADSVLYFNSKTQSGFTGYYNFEGYNCSTGAKETYVVKATSDDSSIDTATTLNGFYTYTVDANGYYSLTAKSASTTYTYNNTYASYYSSLLTTTGANAVTDGDFTDAVVIDARTTAQKKADDGFWKNTITSVSDIDAAKDSGYVVTLQLLCDRTDDNDVLTIVVTSAVTNYTLTNTAGAGNPVTGISGALITVSATAKASDLTCTTGSTLTITGADDVVKSGTTLLAVGDTIKVKATAASAYIIYTVVASLA